MRGPSDSSTLDMLEEIVYHTLVCGDLATAWNIYQQRMGGGGNLALNLGMYERGDHICRAFVQGQSPPTTDFPAMKLTESFIDSSSPGHDVTHDMDTIIPQKDCERRAKRPAPGRLKRLAPEVVPVV